MNHIGKTSILNNLIISKVIWSSIFYAFKITAQYNNYIMA